MSSQKKYILDQAQAEKKLRRMALEILENNEGETELVLAGIRGSGSIVAKALQSILKGISGIHTELVEISMDKKQPREVVLSRDLPVAGKVVIVMDDVANSGRTLLYALKPLLDQQPRKIQALVLVARSHNSFPVHPDYVGVSISTTLQEHIYVEVENDQVRGAYLV